MYTPHNKGKYVYIIEKKANSKPGCGKWCIPNKSRPREMAAWEERG
jgi:hypothetical protein